MRLLFQPGGIALTELGKTLQTPLAAICDWALEHDDAGTGEGSSHV